VLSNAAQGRWREFPASPSREDRDITEFVDGKYETGSYNASFVGFFPAEKPEIVCLVILENPKTGGYTGAMASAPIFKAIAQQIINNNGFFEECGREK